MVRLTPLGDLSHYKALNPFEILGDLQGPPSFAAPLLKAPFPIMGDLPGPPSSARIPSQPRVPILGDPMSPPCLARVPPRPRVPILGDPNSPPCSARSPSRPQVPILGDPMSPPSSRTGPAGRDGIGRFAAGARLRAPDVGRPPPRRQRQKSLQNFPVIRALFSGGRISAENCILPRGLRRVHAAAPGGMARMAGPGDLPHAVRLPHPSRLIGFLPRVFGCGSSEPE